MVLINYASVLPSHLRLVHADNIVQYASTMRDEVHANVAYDAGKMSCGSNKTGCPYTGSII